MRRKRIVKYKSEQIVPIVVGLLEEVVVSFLFHGYYLALQKELKDWEPYLPKDEIDKQIITLLDDIDEESHRIIRYCLIRVAKCRDMLINLYPGVAITAFQNDEVLKLRAAISCNLFAVDKPGKTYRICFSRLQKYVFSLSDFLHWTAQLVLHEELDLNACCHQSYIFGSQSFYLKNQEQHELLLIRMLWELHRDMTAAEEELHDYAP